jgi:hypothetical protein
MRSLYSRPHRGSINEPASIHDIPQEVLENALILLPRRDLVAASSACRAWRPVAQQLLHSGLIIEYDYIPVKFGISRICGYQLDYFVFGAESFQITTLSIDLGKIAKEQIPWIAQIVAPSLSSLKIAINYYEADPFGCYEVLEIFFSRCGGIRNLRLEYFEVGNDPAAISSTIKVGVSRLNQLDLFHCYRDVQLFVENTPFPNLESFRLTSHLDCVDEDVVELVDSAVANFGRSLINLNLDVVSSANLVKISERCRMLEKLTLSIKDGLELGLSDIKIISSIPLLKCLHFGDCEMNEGAVSALTLCRGILKWFVKMA